MSRTPSLSTRTDTDFNVTTGAQLKLTHTNPAAARTEISEDDQIVLRICEIAISNGAAESDPDLGTMVDAALADLRRRHPDLLRTAKIKTVGS